MIGGSSPLERHNRSIWFRIVALARCSTFHVKSEFGCCLGQRNLGHAVKRAEAKLSPLRPTAANGLRDEESGDVEFVFLSPPIPPQPREFWRAAMTMSRLGRAVR